MEVCKYILMTCFLLFPLFVSASTCNVNPSNEFKISFEITSARLLESVTAEKEPGRNNTEYTIWTNDINEPTVGETPFIRDPKYMTVGGDYNVEIIYQPGIRGEAGTADYYVDDGQGFTFLGNYKADFKGIHPQSVNINSGNSSNLECDSSDTNPPPIYSRDAQFQFGVMQCNGSECKVPLNKPFTNTPLVFVMPTIDPANPDSDAPATLVVTNVTKTEATIEQIKAPKNGGGSDLTSQPMTEVSYLAIEPGVADFSGHEVIAGYLDTNRYKSKNGTNGNAESVAYSTFGALQALNSPVVIHQLQTRNNGDRWVTSGKLLGGNDNNEARLFLELSASRVGNNYQEERVGFIATNSTSGSILEVDGYKVQFARGYDTPSQNGNDPMLDGCEDKYATSSLTNIDGIIANKQERVGGHGGWLRRCNVNSNQVSFVVDEDFRDRTHLPEEVGYFAFELEDIPLDICDVTPHVVQSWGGDSSLKWTSNTASIQIKGTYQSSGQVGIWVDPTNPTVNPKTQCDGKECVESSSLYITEPNIVDLDLPTGQNVDAGWQEVALPSGKYNTVSAGGSGTLTLTGDTYYIEHLIIGGGSKLVLSQNTKIYVNSFELSGGGEVIHSDFKLSIWAENYNGSNALVYVTRSLNALIFSRDKVFVSGGNGVVYGRVTAKNIILEPDGKIIDDGQFCSVQPSNYQLTLTPNKDFSLLCETPQVTVTVTDSQGNPVTEQVEVYITIPTGMTFESVIEGRYNGGNSYSTNSSGILTLGLDATSIGTYKIEAELASDSNQNDSGDFLVSLYKFKASDVYAVADQTATFDLKVLACKDDEATLVSGYQGDKKLNVSDFSLVIPTPDQGAVDGNLLVKSKSDWSDTSVTFEFDSSAQSTGSIVYSESGKVSFKLSDPTFECPAGYDCEDNDGESWDALEGNVDVYVRPWKFAICTDNNSDGDSIGGAAFVAAGEAFDVYARPIKYTNSSSVCSDDNLLTNNYFKSTASVQVTTTLETPSTADYPGAELGDLTPETQLTKQISSNDQTNKGYKFESLKYSEVGSFNFIATEAGSFYGSILGGFSGSKSIGRFYPEHLTLISNSWNYSSEHDSFAYMAQGISFNFIVEARNRDNEPVTNYGLFASSLKASLKHVAINEEDGAVLNTRVWLSGGNDADSTSWGEDDWSSARLTIENFDYEFLRLASEDGPYDDTNSQFGLWVSDKVDGVDLQFLDLENTNGGYTNGTKFSFQPDFRYGRMSLKDVGGNQGRNIQVPLEVQYWSGSKFEINSDDSGSQFNGSDYCVTKIWDESDATDAKLTSDTDDNESDDTVSVLNGISSDLIAKQDTSRREQVRLFLRQGSSPSGATCFGSEGTQPWLQYNWRQLGDEDPSTVVTFGIYRGNDRVIYRGESGLTGQ